MSQTASSIAIQAPEIRAISEAFRNARRRGVSLPAFPGDLPQTLAQAYAVQDLSIAQWPDTLAGWKVGGIGGVFREQYAADRLAGPIFSRGIYRCNDRDTITMPTFRGGFAAVEAEFVICLGDVSQLGEVLDSPESLLPGIASVHIGVEIASSPLKTINDVGPAAVVSDFGNNAGLIVGPGIADWNDLLLAQIDVSVVIDGQPIGNARANPGMRGPLGATAFLIQHCRRHGHPMPPGTFITTGAVTGVHEAPIGSHSLVNFAGYGQIQIDLAAFATAD